MQATLQKYLRSKWKWQTIVAFIALLPCLSLISWLFIGLDYNPDINSPGGRFFEISYWATSFGAVFLSFMMMELLFRSRETRLLATFPVPPLALFIYQMRRVFKGIGLSTLAYAAFWMPQLIAEPVIAALSLLIWPLGLAICAALASAILLYAGDNATSEKNNANASAMAFSMAPAIALAVSLMTTLLLKLLAEALLKPGFMDAALTATGITAVVFMGAMLYAARLYHRRYYAILASFMDNDLVVLNASFEFLDDREAKQIRTSSGVIRTLQHALLIQFKRRYPLTSMLVLTFAVVVCLVLWNAPNYMPYLYVSFAGWHLPCFVVVPTLIFSKPWAALRTPAFETELNSLLPVDNETWTRARNAASLRLTLPYHLVLSLCAALPVAHYSGWMAAIVTLLLSGLVCLTVTWGGCQISARMPHHALYAGYGMAVIFMLLGILV